jgi:hypothetical protein
MPDREAARLDRRRFVDDLRRARAFLETHA